MTLKQMVISAKSNLLVTHCLENDFYDQLVQADLADRNCTARIIRGSRCCTVKALFDEISAALQFPPYFGHNWDALADCLSDLRWLEGSHLILGIHDAASLLDHDSSEARQVFADVVSQAVSHLSTSKRKVKLSVILHSDSAKGSASLVSRWSKSGWNLDTVS